MLIVFDFTTYRSKLESFLQIAEREITVSRGDSLALQPLSDSGTVLMFSVLFRI